MHRNMKPQTRFEINRGILHAIGDTMLIVQPVQRQIGLDQSAIRDMITEIGELYYFMSSLEIEFKQGVVFAVGVSDEVKAPSGEGPREISQQPEVGLRLGERNRLHPTSSIAWPQTPVIARRPRLA